jgi:polyphosphate kinase 2 (PPK2 family)
MAKHKPPEHRSPTDLAVAAADDDRPARPRLKTKAYLEELSRLQVELIKLQEWIRQEGLKVVVVFEGRDAAGKGGVIKTITQSLNPRVCRVVALAAPTEREKT